MCISGQFAFPTLLGGAWHHRRALKYFSEQKSMLPLPRALWVCRVLNTSGSKGILSKDCNSHFQRRRTEARGGEERDIL